MSDLEKIVRPFQANIPFTARRLTPDQPAEGSTPEIVTLEWGDTIEANYKQYSIGGLAGATVKWTEVSRQTTTVRVSNPSDESQFVDVERIDRLTMRNEKGQEQELVLNN